jgi:cytochrome P450
MLRHSMGWGLTLTFLPWGARWRAHRALIQKAFTKTNIIKYQHLQEQEARQAVLSIVHEPVEWEQHFRRYESTSRA